MCYKWVESVFRHMYSTFSQNKDGFSQSNGLEFTLFSRPFAAPPSDRKTMESNHGLVFTDPYMR